MDDVADFIAQRFEDSALPTLRDYIEIPCLSPAFDPAWEQTGAIDEALSLLDGWVRTRAIPGLTSQIQRLDGRTPALVIEVPGTAAGSQTALLYGHMDKQPPLGGWDEGLDPFRPVRRGDLLYGRGAGDDGYAVFSALTALEALVRASVPYQRCMIVIEASEESASPDLDAHIAALGSRLDGVDLVVCLDSGALDYKRLWITTSLRGTVVIALKVDVLRHGVHSGQAGGVVPSSFRIARQLLSRIEDQHTGEILLPELNARPPEHLLAAAAHLAHEFGDPLADEFPTVPGLELMGRDGAERLLRQAWSPSLAMVGIDGVPSVAEGGNVLRASTTLKLSLRIPPSVDVAVAQDAVVRALASDPPHHAQVTVTPELAGQGWVAPSLAPWLATALAEGSTLGFGHEPGFVGEGGSIPFLASLGERFPNAQIVATGVLGPGSNAHGPNESLHIPTAIGVTTALAVTLQAHGRVGMGKEI